VAALPRQERARLFVSMAADIADRLPGIEFDPRVCGGSARIAGTRIPVWSLEPWRRLGAPDEEILRNYPSLQASDLLNAWQYVSCHPREIDREIRENAADAPRIEMARLYANENFPLDAVAHLRARGHDVQTTHRSMASRIRLTRVLQCLQFSFDSGLIPVRTSVASRAGP
jgi:uncharacterized protein (DUF433 family)